MRIIGSPDLACYFVVPVLALLRPYPETPIDACNVRETLPRSLVEKKSLRIHLSCFLLLMSARPRLVVVAGVLEASAVLLFGFGLAVMFL